MSYIDWTDPEEMFGLLVEFVEDERGEAHSDPKRRRFLATLLAELMALQDRFATLAPRESIASLQELQDSVDEEFADDPVVEHLSACVEELKRLRGADAV